MLATLRIYGECLARLPGDLRRNPWVLLLPALYAFIAQLAAMIAAHLGILGGFLMGFTQAALAASFLYFVEEVLGRSRTLPHELPRSFQRYLWPVVNVLFVFWVASLLLGVVARGIPTWVALGVGVVLFVLLNATPEVIYQRRLWNGLDVLSASVQFIQANWIEWFVPNLPLGLTAAAVSLGFIPVEAIFDGLLGPWLGAILFGLIQGGLLFIYFLFRGHLFQALDRTPARARRLRYG
jgi:hypothetical protein